MAIPGDTATRALPENAPAPAPTPQRLLLPPRYRLGPLLGRGGMGEVWRVRDQHLDRDVALKVLRIELAQSAAARARFLLEATLTADLNHPGVVSVHDMGQLEDGRPWYTLREVRGGRTLTEAIAPGGGWRRPDLRALLGAVLAIANAVGYAHSRGTIHRDLKPSNILLGAFGEVLVLDWGLARRHAEAEATGPIDAELAQGLTRAGAQLGTLPYLPPEQALGRPDQHGPWSDVYALGAITYEILADRPLYPGDAAEMAARLAHGPPEPVAVAAPGAPEELTELVSAALARDPAARPAHAGLYAARLQRWLDGALRWERAWSLVAESDALAPQVEALRGEARALMTRASSTLAAIPPHAPAADKQAAWDQEDQARALSLEATRQEEIRLQRLYSALVEVPELAEAHERLADHHQRLQAEAEAREDAEAAALAEAALRAHDLGRHRRWLQGDGALTLWTDPPDARIQLHRYVERGRRWVPEPYGPPRGGPLDALPLPMGRYLAVVSRHGYAQTRIPLCVRRQEHVSHTPPGHAAPRPIRLLRPDELGEDDVYVPSGWFWSGTDDASVRGRLPRRHLWADAFVIRRFPVTNAEYLAWLDALVARGEEEEALARAPRYPGRDASPGALIYGRRPDGGFCLIRDNAGDLWEPDAPVLMIRWEDAAAFCAWEAARTGLPWRLPMDLEREKAARGADGRRYPWGEVLDPSFTAMRLSHAGPPQPAPVSAYPTDESPYGVRGLAGNAMDWCQDVFRPEGPPISPEGLALPDPLGDGPSRVCRGGGWFFVAGDCRAEVRWQVPPRTRREDCSFRLCRSI